MRVPSCQVLDQAATRWLLMMHVRTIIHSIIFSPSIIFMRVPSCQAFDQAATRWLSMMHVRAQ
jgi:hypothetical protein